MGSRAARAGSSSTHFLPGDGAVARGAPGALGVVLALAQPIARHDVVQIQPHPHQPVRAHPLEGGHDERERPHEVRRERDHQLALQECLAHEAEIEVL